MALSIGIVGLPNVGKSTLFNALTAGDALAANYPFATIEPNTGIVAVPDKRLDKLAELYPTAKVVPAVVNFVDIAGLVAGAHKGEGLGNQFLANIRECAAILHLVRAFEDDNVQHVDTNRTPTSDIETIDTELILADLQTIDKRLPRLQKEARANPSLRAEVSTLEKARAILDAGQPLYSVILSASEESRSFANAQDDIGDLQLLTLKPVIYLFNVDEADLGDTKKREELAELVTPRPALFASAQFEAELNALEPPERAEMLTLAGLQASGLEQVIRAAYETLGLQSFLTAGDKEIRGWTIPKDATAPQAAGAIHGDFQRGFIAAEVVNYDDLITAGSRTVAKAAGQVRTEGKTYHMQDGDVVEFRFNV